MAYWHDENLHHSFFPNDLKCRHFETPNSPKATAVVKLSDMTIISLKLALFRKFARRCNNRILFVANIFQNGTASILDFAQTWPLTESPQRGVLEPRGAIIISYRLISLAFPS